MFFEPPKVKSLSRYAEYGAYPGNRYFLIALAVAITAHLAIIAVYSMVPRETVMKIPVRVLNIKLSGGSEANGIYLPQKSAMPSMEAAPEENEAMKPVVRESAESAIEKALKNQQEKKAATKNHPAPAGPGKTVRPAKDVKKTDHGKFSEFSLSIPKKYVREGEARPAASKGKTAGGNGSGITGEAGGKEVIDRYEQTISQWIQNHQDYAMAAYRQAAEGQGNLKGVAVVMIRIDREGHILYNSIDTTSGNELVDQVAIAMVRASDPVPAAPGDYPSGNQIQYLIHVTVDLSKH